MLWLPLFKILYNVHFKITVNFVYKRTKHQRVPSREGVTGSFKFFNGNPQVESHCYDVTIKTSVCVFFFSLFRFNFILFWNDVYIYISKHSLNWINPPPQKKIIKKKSHIVELFLSSSLCDRLHRSPGSKYTGKHTAELPLLHLTLLYFMLAPVIRFIRYRSCNWLI